MKTASFVFFGSGALVCAGLLLPLPGIAGPLSASPIRPEQAMPASGLCVPYENQQSAQASRAFSSSPIFDANASIAERLSLVDRLGRDLSRDQIAELYAFLKALPSPAERNLPALNLLKNDIVSRLQDQSYPPSGLTATLIEVCRNRAQDAVARDYALQHLVTWSEQGAGDAPESKAEIQAVLWKAVRENTSLAGTALLGLHRLSGAVSSAGEEISRAALRMLDCPGLPCASRVTAIQVCAEREVAPALPAIQNLAQSQGETALRISAIGALGWLGGPEQAVLLQQLEAGQDRALKPAIEGALRRLQARLLKNPVLTQNSL